MHGRPREYKNKLNEPKAQEAYAKKVDAIRTGTSLVLACHASRRYDSIALDSSAKLLKVIPEIYTLWNFRREALAAAFAEGGAAAQAASQGELSLTHACLQENPKSYSAWHHRKWVVLKGLCSRDTELDIITRALDQDSRNFHAWHYRRFIVALMGRPPAAELEYSEDKIAQNFSNYSAWHYRTVLLPRVHGGDGGAVDAAAARGGAAGTSGRDAVDSAAADLGACLSSSATLADSIPPAAAAVPAGSSSAAEAPPPPPPPRQGPIPVSALDEEYDLVQQAFATDSEDQAPWMYYRWLLGNSLSHLEHARGTGEEDAARAVLKAVLAREIGRFEEDHIAAAPDARWPLLTVARLRQAQARLQLSDRPVEELQAQIRGTFERLMLLDPMRRGYYQDERDGKAQALIQALGA